jgi:hypothetical protein
LFSLSIVTLTYIYSELLGVFLQPVACGEYPGKHNHRIVVDIQVSFQTVAVRKEDATFGKAFMGIEELSISRALLRGPAHSCFTQQMSSCWAPNWGAASQPWSRPLPS